MIQRNLFTKQKLIDNELMFTRGEGWGEGIDKEFETDMYTRLCFKWITNISPPALAPAPTSYLDPS